MDIRIDHHFHDKAGARMDEVLGLLHSLVGKGDQQTAILEQVLVLVKEPSPELVAAIEAQIARLKDIKAASDATATAT